MRFRRPYRARLRRERRRGTFFGLPVATMGEHAPSCLSGRGSLGKKRRKNIFRRFGRGAVSGEALIAGTTDSGSSVCGGVSSGNSSANALAADGNSSAGISPCAVSALSGAAASLTKSTRPPISVSRVNFGQSRTDRIPRSGIIVYSELGYRADPSGDCCPTVQ